jgi:hypothetical protein
MALGYSVSSPSMYPGIRYTGRQSSDPLGTMVGEYTIINGGGYSSSNRWGDYSSMNVDPVDDCTFWYTMEYPNANNNWDTQIASFAFDSCTNPVSWDNQIFVTQSTDYGTSWNAPTQITNNTDEQYHPRIAAAIGNDSVVVAYTRDWVSTGDTDVMYYYSTDGGATWNGENSLPWSLNNEESVDLAASNDLGNFHAVYWANYDIWHTSAPVATPNVWSSPATVVNELNFASLGYPRPTVTVNPIAPLDAEAAVAWTDFRNPNHAIYFDSAGLGQPDKIGVYRPSGKRFYLDVDGNFLWNPPPDLSVPFGAVGDTPITGDWNGDGVDEIGVYRSSIRLFYLDVDGAYVWNPAIDVTAPFGAVGDTPIIGDWNGDGVDEIGVYRSSIRRFYLDLDGSLSWDPALDLTTAFGGVGDTPIAGDWSGDGRDQIGVHRASIKRFYMDTDGDYVWNPALDTTVAFGAVGDTSIIGDWNGDGVDEIGVYRPPVKLFFMDTNGDFVWNPAVDVSAAFGAVGDEPIIGNW